MPKQWLASQSVGIPSWIRIQIGIPSWIVDPFGECGFKFTYFFWCDTTLRWSACFSKEQRPYHAAGSPQDSSMCNKRRMGRLHHSSDMTTTEALRQFKHDVAMPFNGSGFDIPLIAPLTIREADPVMIYQTSCTPILSISHTMVSSRVSRKPRTFLQEKPIMFIL